jgi:competence protein ComEA
VGWSNCYWPIAYYLLPNAYSLEAPMTPDKLNRWWMLITVLLVLLIVVSLIIIRVNRGSAQSLTIQPAQHPQYSGQVYIDGAVNQPGAYDFNQNDSIGRLLESSGGLLSDADLSALQIRVPSTLISPDYQRININRAESWLLQALPGIGETKALAILDYRHQIGHFKNIEQLTEVPGISQSVFDKIKGFITTSEQ